MCRMTGCNAVGTKKCSACGVVSYCSVECQKGDWKGHKRACIDVKKLPTTFVASSEINKYMEKMDGHMNILKDERKEIEAINAMDIYLAWLENQLGTEIKGQSAYRRKNGEILDNAMITQVRIEITNLHLIIQDTANQLPFLIKTRRMLDHRDQSDDDSLDQLCTAEQCLTTYYSQVGLLTESAHHAEQSLKFAQRIRGEDRLAREFDALKGIAYLKGLEGRTLEAIDYSEKAYILASEAYGPVHPEVQNISQLLIEYLIVNQDYQRADDYCRMNYENLTAPRFGAAHMQLVPMTMKQIATIFTLRDPPANKDEAFALAEEAEDMARKSIAIIEKQKRPPHELQRYCAALGSVLLKRGKINEEARSLLERSHNLYLLHPNPQNETIESNLKLLIEYHEHMSETLPSGEARDREIALRLKYVQEFNAVNPRYNTIVRFGPNGEGTIERVENGELVNGGSPCKKVE